LESLVSFWEIAAKLKSELRKGWLAKLRLQRPESVADHSFALALICLFEGQRRGYDVEKMLKLAILHDVEEAITGDLTPEDKRSKGKLAVESQRLSARKQLIGHLPRESQRIYEELWSELDEDHTKESRLVHELDKLEMALQANAYSKSGAEPGKLQEFYESAKNEIKDPHLRSILNEISS
jgi:putative hydrolases of HD superfamily